jgi:nucleoid DNA-binding protein
MLKTEIIDQVAKEAHLTRKAAKEAIEAVFTIIKDSLNNGDKVVVSGFGTFILRERRSRVGRNPKTGATLTLPSMKTIGFIASKNLKKRVR